MNTNDISFLSKELLKYQENHKSSIRISQHDLDGIVDFCKKTSSSFYSPDVGMLYLSELGDDVEKQKKTGFILQELNYILLNSENFGTKSRKLFQHSSNDRILFEYMNSLHDSGHETLDIRHRIHVISRFLAALDDRNHPLSLLNSLIITEIYSETTEKQWFTVAVKSFIRYLKRRGIIETDCSSSIPGYRKHRSVPSVYSKKEIQRVMDCIDTAAGTGIRNKAIILMAYNLAMRSGDIVNLRIKDLNLKNKTLKYIQQKTEMPISFSLSEEVLKAITDYISYSRPKCGCDYLFVKAGGTHGKLSASSVYRIVSGCFLKAGIDIKGKRHGAHSLRASKATEMIGEDIPISIVSAYLGHKTTQSTKSYYFAETESLRKCSITFPAIANGSLLGKLLGDR